MSNRKSDLSHIIMVIIDKYNGSKFMRRINMKKLCLRNTLFITVGYHI